MLKKIVKQSVLGLSVAAALSAPAMARDVVVDVYYTPAAEARSNNIQTEIANIIATSNRNYRDNDLDINLVLAATPYNIGTNYTANLSDLRSVYKASNIRNWRDEFKADFVVVLGSKESSWQGTTCGIAGDIYGLKIFPDHDNYESYAYNITANNCGNTTMTFMHELGHNMGLGHSVRQGATGGVYSWGVGYGVDYEFATIMAYPHEFNTSNHPPIFSDPDRSCGSNPCGVANVADSQRALDLVTNTIANFR
ncbi:zinc-dependent metalloprotease family protein [Flocculibacter collagenilyticus]|uniref:zinc-dependent metalloprotease family protein n=1 Tax=Flocculibacter collagenilyticus TaxID=2744479 RepID=UPI0018F2AF7B|nr:zinc-dependent metalloprotease family protein [Flocculibacter collagenilyticus]